MGMPKVKPESVIRHEIVLGRADRELLAGAVAASMYIVATIIELFGKDIRCEGLDG